MYQSLPTLQHSLLKFTTFLFLSILDLTVFFSYSTDSTSQTSSSVSTDIISSSQNTLQIFQQPPLNPIPVIPSLNTTPINTPSRTPIKTSVPQHSQTSLTLPFSDTDFPLSTFNITPTHSPPSSLLHIPDPSDNDPLLLRIINNPTAPKSIVIPTSITFFVDVLNLINLFQFLHLVPISHLNPHFPHLNPLKFLHLNHLIPFKRNLISVKLIQRLLLSFIHVFLLPIPLLNTLLLL